MPWDVFWTFALQGTIFTLLLLLAGFIGSVIIMAIMKGFDRK